MNHDDQVETDFVAFDKLLQQSPLPMEKGTRIASGGEFMWMHDKGDVVSFKHCDTRRYIEFNRKTNSMVYNLDATFDFGM